MEHQIITRAEALEQGLKRYFTGIVCTNNHLSESYVSNKTCIICLKQTKDNWKTKYPEKVREQDSRWCKNNRDKVNASSRKSYANDSTNKKKLVKKWRSENLAKCRYWSAKYRARVIQACISWSNDQAISKIYETCPEGFHVDHIVPLQSDTVCGLHTEANLEHKEGSLNCSKGNRWWPNDWLGSL